MNNFPEPNSDSKSNISEREMAYLQERLRQQAQRRPLYENIAILGCGYVGSALAACWDEHGHFVTGTTTSRDRITDLSPIVSRVALMRGDDASGIQSLLQDQDTVVVSVAPTGSQLADAATYETTYLDTAKNLVEALNQSPRVKQIIYLSSCSVYGDRQGGLVDETSPIFHTERRAQVLHETEEILSQANSNERKVCIFRLGGIYGPGRELVRMYGGVSGMNLPGKGERVINWIHRDDIVGAIEFARQQQLQGIYNLVDDSQLSVREQLEQVCLSYGLPPVVWDNSQQSLHRPSLRVSNQKLKEAGYPLIHPQLLIWEEIS